MTTRTHSLGRLIATALILAAACVPLRADAQDRIAVMLGAGGIVGTDPSPAKPFAEPLVIRQPPVCGTYVNARTRGPLPNVRMLGGIEVPLGRRLALVGTARSDASGLEDRSHAVTAIGGVRLSLR